MNFKSAIFKYRKLIMLTLSLVAVIICLVATYVTEYNNNKIEIEELFTIEETRKYKTSEEFLNFFDSFSIVLSKEVDPHEDENGNLVKTTKTFTVSTTLKETSEIKKVSMKICLAADWVNYVSNIGSSSSNMTLDSDNTIQITGIDTKFPLEGNLWFVKVDQPTLYVLVYWSENNTHYYTYLQYTHSEYKAK